MAKSNENPQEFKWLDTHDGSNLVRVCRFGDETNAVAWKRSNGSWVGHVYKPMFADISKGQLTQEKAKKAVLDEIKRQYREIQAALQKVAIGPTTKS